MTELGSVRDGALRPRADYYLLISAQLVFDYCLTKFRSISDHFRAISVSELTILLTMLNVSKPPKDIKEKLGNSLTVVESSIRRASDHRQLNVAPSEDGEVQSRFPTFPSNGSCEKVLRTMSRI